MVPGCVLDMITQNVGSSWNSPYLSVLSAPASHLCDLFFLPYESKTCADSHPAAASAGCSRGLPMACSLCSFNKGLVCSSSINAATWCPVETGSILRIPTRFWENRCNSPSVFVVWNKDNPVSFSGLFWTADLFGRWFLRAVPNQAL